MTETRERLLSSRLRASVEQQPEIEIIRKLMLELGGTQLVAPPEPDFAIHLLVDAGFVMTGLIRWKNWKTEYALKSDTELLGSAPGMP